LVNLCENSSVEAGRCNGVLILAHLCRRGCVVDSTSTQALQRNRLCQTRTQEHGLRFGRDDDRSVLKPVLLGTALQNQGRRQTAHALRPEKSNYCFYQYQRRKYARSQLAGLFANRSWSVLRNGTWQSGFRTTFHAASNDEKYLKTPHSKHD
jgi:hypothetical protein